MHLVNIFSASKTKLGMIVLFVILFQLISTQYANAAETYRLTKVVIDAGHGGKDPGAVGKKSAEKDITLSVALKLGKYIQQAFPEVEVIYTRKEDVFIGLDERSRLANEKGADLFISIHCNANPSRVPFGAETYVMGLHKTNDNLDVAKRENAVITFEEDYSTKYEGYDPTSSESFIIFSLIQNTHLEQSLTFASVIQDEFRERAQRKDRGVKQAGFLVLWKTTMPSVLVELGFISNPKEEEFLMSDSGQDYLASSIFRAFREHKKNIEARSNFVVEKATPMPKPRSSTPAKQPAAATITIVTPSEKTEKGPEAKPTPTSSNSIPMELTYRVQITSSSKSISLTSPFFKKLDGIEEFFIDGFFKYYIGNKKSYSEIAEYSSQIKELFPDAFIVAFYNGKQISLDQARQISTQ